MLHLIVCPEFRSFSHHLTQIIDIRSAIATMFVACPVPKAPNAGGVPSFDISHTGTNGIVVKLGKHTLTMPNVPGKAQYYSKMTDSQKYPLVEANDVRLIKANLPCGHVITYECQGNFSEGVEKTAEEMRCDPSRVIAMFNTTHDFKLYELEAYERGTHKDFLAFVSVDGVMLRKDREVPNESVYVYVPLRSTLYELCIHRLASMYIRREPETTEMEWTVTTKDLQKLYGSMKDDDMLAVCKQKHIDILRSTSPGLKASKKGHLA
jgi:hypothetical protein